ncbi:MocR-like pyridoxine biosynthesis transcription factor PdxR [Pluralibacter gergoviae]|uniref:MocR-like pyridoxine biosynthesis transcription factor PdxR n=1 Tax=Pluralibacter gergoviae TaxID=61647 RepID=UPI00065075C2|nr:PLP-dependent aminotransferase family protein [Pluralibacter gergoviae]EKV0928014.1 PLP-dependent aminotransferase family protein [Pluralibacter gergoviae]EKV6245950.1 PLP-dependent aminotransferase family protein [Pluralibacter gergoviae]EKW6617995.1 PLP-dependent aminotransferase family protein [Pluralibacter gergoviae]EKW9968355.1 PLP-dependent aminotransferase family protein [Pluralibacter gergoviae]ELD4269276.1 PLP-dependent aminotransferase family protein [Pluralibacter gergoviae]
MIKHLLHVDFDRQRGLQEQVRETLVSAILSGLFDARTPLPSCRQLAAQLNVSRNTTALVFESLVNEGYLISRPRSGYYLHPEYQQAVANMPERAPADEAHAPRWCSRLKITPSQQESILKPAGWMHYRYPFIYGQPDTRQFPLASWRAAASWLHGGGREPDWVVDHIDKDVPMLIEQIRTRILPRRGIAACADEILITLGSQNALYLLTRLLLARGTRMGVENPGFREAINTFQLSGCDIVPHEVDSEGLRLGEARCDYYYVTPGHQVPTGVAMSSARRSQLLAHAAASDAVIIEDDYDSESNFTRNPQPALKAGDAQGRVIYVSSLSKALSPGLRLGFMVADPELIDEARALRRLTYRHPPTNIQHQMAHFLAQGHYDTHLRRYRDDSARRWDRLDAALKQLLPECRPLPGSEHANAFWLRTPSGVNTQQLTWRAAHAGVLIEPGARHFLDDAPPENYFRMGFHAIDPEAIAPGVAILQDQLARI